MIDPVTAECIRIRDQIFQEAGSVDAYFDQLEELDRQRLAADAAKKAARKTRTPKKKPSKKPTDK